MNVGELVSELLQMDQSIQVIIQKDSEGNGYSPLAGTDAGCIYTPDSTWSGEVVSTEWSADEACMDPEEWKEFKKKPRVCVLYPVN